MTMAHNRSQRRKPDVPRGFQNLGLKPRALLDLVETHFDVKSRAGEEVMAMCPWHDNTRTASLQINVTTGSFVCFSSACGAKGGVKALKRYCGVPVDEDGEGISVSEMYARLDALNDQHKRWDDSQMDTLPDDSLLRRYQFPTTYWTDRGLRPETVAAFDLGYDPMNDAVTIPIRNRDGELYGVIHRDLTGAKDANKYHYPKGFKKTQDMFGSWFAQRWPGDELVIVEGSIDAMKVWQAGFCAMAQYGSALSYAQVRMIRSMGFTRIVTFFDNDKAGRAAYDVCKGWHTRMRSGKKENEYDPRTDLRRDFLLYNVHYKGGMGSDPGSCDDIAIADAIVNAKLVS